MAMTLLEHRYVATNRLQYNNRSGDAHQGLEMLWSFSIQFPELE